MTNFNKILTTGDIENNIINAVIEVPKGSKKKLEWHRQTGEFGLDKERPANLGEPANYGFIPRTLNDDGDELDILVLDDEPIEAGSILKVRVVGVMKFEDEGVVDDKIITVPLDNKTTYDLGDISKQDVKQITDYFTHYKDYMGSGYTLVKGWEDVDSAKRVIINSREVWARDDG